MPRERQAEMPIQRHLTIVADADAEVTPATRQGPTNRDRAADSRRATRHPLATRVRAADSRPAATGNAAAEAQRARAVESRTCIPCPLRAFVLGIHIPPSRIVRPGHVESAWDHAEPGDHAETPGRRGSALLAEPVRASTPDHPAAADALRVIPIRADRRGSD